MAGRQRRNEMIHQLERRLAKWAETQDEDQSYDVADYVCSWVRSGFTITKLTDELSEDMKWDISRDMLMRYLNEGRPDMARRLEKARQEGAHGMVDQAIKIVDSTPADKELIQKAKLQADTRMWTAERWNKKDLGRAPDTQIVINHNTLHLDAMRARQLQRAHQAERVLDQPGSYAPARLIEGADSSAESVDVIADVISIEPGAS